MHPAGAAHGRCRTGRPPLDPTTGVTAWRCLAGMSHQVLQDLLGGGPVSRGSITIHQFQPDPPLRRVFCCFLEHTHDPRPFPTAIGRGVREKRLAAGQTSLPAEIACRGTGKLLVNEPALDRLQALRATGLEAADRPLTPIKASRSTTATVGGATPLPSTSTPAFAHIAMTNQTLGPSRRRRARGVVPSSASGFYSALGGSHGHVDLGTPPRQWGRALPRPGATALRRRNAHQPREVFGRQPPPLKPPLRLARPGVGRSALGAGVRFRGWSSRVLAETQSRHPAAGAVPRHLAVGVYPVARRGTYGTPLRPSRRLEAGTTVIAVCSRGSRQPGGAVGAALRRPSSSPLLPFLLSPSALRAPAGGGYGLRRRRLETTEEAKVTSNAGCWRAGGSSGRPSRSQRAC